MERLWSASRSDEYRAPTPEALAETERLFRRALAGETGNALAADWAALGYKMEQVTDWNQVFTVVHEQPDQCWGRGFYVFAALPAGHPVLQAPHSFHDLHTGAIALRLFGQGRFAAGAWNTVRRSYQNRDGEKVNADMAHAPESPFIAFSRAVAFVRPASAILQLHGFKAEERKTQTGRAAGAIISAGQRQPTAAAERTARCLDALFTEPVLLYPIQVEELGGVTNAIGQTLRALGSNAFVHIELAQPLREQLRDNEALQGSFGDCLAGVWP
ncbi:MAG TPA: hypothetical protein P5330_08365 [Candidatus Competibacteraceae bacterium]|nr:hypothetical protein [Candidatus Competibacteraceae bacterium]